MKIEEGRYRLLFEYNMTPEIKEDPQVLHNAIGEALAPYMDIKRSKIVFEQ